MYTIPNIIWGSLTLTKNCLLLSTCKGEGGRKGRGGEREEGRKREKEKRGGGRENSYKIGKLWLGGLVKFIFCQHGVFIGKDTFRH